MNASKLLCILAMVALALGVSGVARVSAQTATAIMPDVKIDGHYGNWLPPDVSQNGPKVDHLIVVLHWFMGVLFVGWGIFFIYCLVRFRRRAGCPASYQPVKASVSKYAEIAVAAFEAVLLIGFSVPIWAQVKNERPSEAQHPLHVRVLAEQFQWNFHYAGPDGVFGRSAPEFVDSTDNPVGLDPSDSAGKDDVVSGEFHIPVNRPIIAELTSKDVIHSFFIPVMRVKQDVIPGMRISSWFEAVKTGHYEVACAQLCGNNHYSMRALLTIETEDQFAAWLKKAGIVEEFDEDEME